MHCKVFQKWVNVIVFPEDIKLIDVIEVIQKYIEMEIKENKKFAKVNMRDVIKHKIKWVFKILWLCLNYPFHKLLEWM